MLVVGGEADGVPAGEIRCAMANAGDTPFDEIRPATEIGPSVGSVGSGSSDQGPAAAEFRAADRASVKFLTVAEVAAMIRVSKMTVYRMLHNGEIPAVRVGRSFRVTEKDVDEFIRRSFYDAG